MKTASLSKPNALKLTRSGPAGPQGPKPEHPEKTDQRVASRHNLPPHPARIFQAKADRLVDCGFKAVGLLLSVAGCGVAGALGGALAGSLLGPTGAVAGLAAGATTGAIGGGLAYLRGHGDILGKSAMAAAAVALGAMLGSPGGTTGVVIGAALGSAYAAAGLYFSQD